ncbi:peptidoglycan-binding protein [Pseudaminobacter arsenicus]|uniref:Peptidoglycan-binding protein n=1 Tax=Borborobacter arsenicus TaxID=1851146 RepID=A0A432V9S6_9HYPH|nr:peptidoglycan-binding protein [Pseudaminobacter arsenicus]RUM98866.1 peptidoglycan-binding protein [Pseudaminobacter arsenicus]
MNSKRSYLESLNAGRPRRPYTTLEDLNRSLANLEQRIGHSQAPSDAYDRTRTGGNSTDLPNPPADERVAATNARTSLSTGPSYQAIARDLQRVRSQEDGVAAFGKIADELQQLREELRQQVTSGMRREFEALRQDMGRAYSTGTARGASELGLEFERLSSAINSLSERSDDKSINMLRLEVEQVRKALDTLAREETVLSVDRRWDDFDRRWSDFEDRVSTGRMQDPALATLTARLEQISDAVSNLPESLSLRSLEEKVRALAGAVDHFARQQEHGDATTLGLIEERLDEISRAIVASTAAAKMPNFDPEPFERIEARIVSLAHQIEEVAGDQRPNAEVMDRLNLLSRRVDEITAQIHLPEQAVERLANQIGSIAEKIDRAPAAADADYIFQGVEKRFDLLASVIERRQDDALEHGNMLFRDLEQRLEEVAARLDQRAATSAFDNEGIMQAIDARFGALAERIESRKPDLSDNDTIRSLEARLEAISNRLDHSASQYSGVDPDLIRNLEAQVAGLTEHLARPSAPLPEFEDIGPRLNEIERSIAGSHDAILEAARQAAENAVHSFGGSQMQTEAVSGLAEDLKALETLTRRSDERNARTFEAIHDTLLKIVDRLGSLEQGNGSEAAPEVAPRAPLRKMAAQDTPSLVVEDSLPLFDDLGDLDRSDIAEAAPQVVARTPAEAAVAAAAAALDSDTIADDEPEARSRSMLSGLARVFSRKGHAAAMPAEPETLPVDDVPAVDLDEPLDPKLANRPLTPGSGAPDLNAIMKRVRDERGQTGRQAETDAAKSDFIAAARRAAQAAAAEAEALKRHSDIKGPVRALRVGDLLKARRKPILMAAAAIMMALAGLQLGKAFLADDTEMAETVPAPAISQEHIETAAAAADEPMDSLGAEDGSITANTLTDPAEQSAEMAASPSVEPAAAPTSSEVDTASAAPKADGALEADPIAATAPLVPNEAAPTQAAAPAISVPLEAGPIPLRDAANAGDAKALFEVGSRYADGRGVTSDMAAAAKWYEKSAELGFAPAQYRIGNFYEKGLGVERDIEKAKTWYQLAAAQGNASAMHNLAVLFAMGADGTTDNESATRWFIQAAELGVKDSQYNLGILAAKGVGMAQSLEESYKWFALVAKTGDKDAAAKRDEIANSLRPEQLERARAATELWKPKPLNALANSVEIPEAWQESPTTTASIDMKKAVRNIQAILNKNGYDAGNADGVLGEKTKTAIAAFQKDNDMEPTGEVNEKVVRALLARK